MHRLVSIKRRQLICTRCGEPASVGSGSSRVIVTGHYIGRHLMACEDCLSYWASAHRCQIAA